MATTTMTRMQRNKLSSSLAESIGQEASAILMEQLPPHGLGSDCNER